MKQGRIESNILFYLCCFVFFLFPLKKQNTPIMAQWDALLQGTAVPSVEEKSMEHSSVCSGLKWVSP